MLKVQARTRSTTTRKVGKKAMRSTRAVHCHPYTALVIVQSSSLMIRSTVTPSASAL